MWSYMSLSFLGESVQTPINSQRQNLPSRAIVEHVGVVFPFASFDFCGGHCAVAAAAEELMR